MKGEIEARGHERRADLLLILLFWTAAFAVSSIRGSVAGEIPFDQMAAHRLAIMLFGAFLCWGMIHVLEKAGSRGVAEKGLLALGGAAVMAFLQSIFHLMSCRVAPIEGVAPMTVPEAVNAGMISLAYFVAWSWMHLAIVYHRQAERQAEAMRDRPSPAALPASQVPAERSFWASRGRQHVRVRMDDIVWVEAQKDYVLLHAPGGGGMLRETLSSVQAKLDPNAFVRVHRSVIVRRNAIVAIRRKQSGALIATLASGEEVPVGRNYASGVRRLIEDLGKPL